MVALVTLVLSVLRKYSLPSLPGCSKCALEKHEGIVPQLQANQAEVRVTNELGSSTEGKSVAKE